MFGATVANPLVLAPAFCIAEGDKVAVSMIIGTIFVCSGLATLLQTILGIRLGNGHFIIRHMFYIVLNLTGHEKLPFACM